MHDYGRSTEAIILNEIFSRISRKNSTWKLIPVTQPAFTSPHVTIETLEQRAKYVQNY